MRLALNGAFRIQLLWVLHSEKNDMFISHWRAPLSFWGLTRHLVLRNMKELFIQIITFVVEDSQLLHIALLSISSPSIYSLTCRWSKMQQVLIHKNNSVRSQKISVRSLNYLRNPLWSWQMPLDCSQHTYWCFLDDWSPACSPALPCIFLSVSHSVFAVICACFFLSLCPPAFQHLVSYLSHAVPLIPALSSRLLSSLLWLVYQLFSALSFHYLLWIPLYFSWAVTCISHVVPFCSFLLLPGTLPSDPLQSQYDSWLYLVDHLNIKAFVNLTLANSVRHGIQHLLFISGLGQCHHHHHKISLWVS